MMGNQQVWVLNFIFVCLVLGVGVELNQESQQTLKSEKPLLKQSLKSI
jgi:hypothetical protein